MTKEQIIILVLAIALAIAVVAIICLAILINRKTSENGVKKVKIKNGVRYTLDEKIADGESANVTHVEGDIILAAGKTYKAEKGGKLIPGTYTVLAVSEKTETFKLRLGGIVREYNHGDTVVLGEGEEICAVSASVILR